MFILRELLSTLIKLSGIPYLIYHFVAKKKVSIILYHNPPSDVLEHHLRYLSKKYNFISLNTLVDAIERQDFSNIPKFAMVITFDDGTKENYQLLTLFKEFSLVPTIYVCTGIVGTNRHYWWSEFSGKKGQSLKHYSHNERLDCLMKDKGFYQEKEYDEGDREALNLKEISEMLGFVDFQSHTVFHPILTTCDDSNCWKEISDSIDGLEGVCGVKAKHLSYPNGDYGKREIEFAKKAGFRSARTIDTGWNTIETDPFQLRITGVSDAASINILKVQLSGLTSFFRYMLKGSFGGKYKTIRHVC